MAPKRSTTKTCPLEQIEKGRALSDFVKFEFETGGATFTQAGLSPELFQLLQNVKLVQKAMTPGIGKSSGASHTWPDLLALLRQRFNLRLDEDISSMSQWQQLYSLLGGDSLLKMFRMYQVYICVGGSRWLQVTGSWQSKGRVGEAAKMKTWTPSEILIKRPIFHCSKFLAKAGLPLRNCLRQVPPDETGARSFIWWILSPQFYHLDVPPDPSLVPMEPKRQRAKRQRGPRKRKASAQVPERVSKQRKTAAAAEKHVPSLQREVLVEALMEPVLQMLKKTPTVKFQELLSKHCSSNHALMILKVFEKKNQACGDRSLPRIQGLRCYCHSSKAKKKTPTSGKSFRCTGGQNEIRFMREFPSLSCAVSGRRVARFLCAAVFEVVGRELLGAKNWLKLVESLKLLVHLRRFEELSVHDILQHLSVREFKDGMIRRYRQAHQAQSKGSRLGQLQDNRVMAEVMGRLCYFILAHLAVPLLRGHFYATEGEPGGMQTIYFRKNVWHFLRSRADCGFLHLCMNKGNDVTKVESNLSATDL